MIHIPDYDSYDQYRENTDGWVESWQYIALRGEQANLTVGHMLIDHTRSHIDYNHSLWVYITNNYIEETTNCIAITVDIMPTVIGSTTHFSDKEIDECIQFVKQHNELLRKFANGHMNHHTFLNILQSQILQHNHKAEIYNESSLLYDMELAEYIELSPEKTGLSVSVFADESANIVQRQPLLYFTNGKSTHNWLNVIPMTVSMNPQILINHVKLNIAPTEVDKIKSWIVSNYEVLMAHALGKINYLQFIKELTK